MTSNKPSKAEIDAIDIKDEAMLLHSTEDVARILDVSSPTVIWWVKKKIFPKPFAVYGTQKRSLWSTEQLDEMIKAYEENATHQSKLAKARKNKFSNTPEEPVLPAPTEEKLEVDDRIGTYCSCGALYFDWDTHNKFAHRGKLSRVGANG
jgi:hypothetical protein